MSNIVRYLDSEREAFITESVSISLPKIPRKNLAFVMESLREDGFASPKMVPDVIYPLIHCIRADAVTRNKTYYPASALVGNPDEYTGYISWKVPYPTPWIEGHNTNGGLFGGSGSDIFGRTIESFWSTNADNTKGVVAAIPAIMSPYAIERILDGRWSTVSIGCSTESVVCSICGYDWVQNEGGCPHEKGKKYRKDEDSPEEECHWIIGPVKNRETSFVTVPSDVGARVADPNTNPEAFSIFAGNPQKEYIFNVSDPLQTNLLEHADPILSDMAARICLESKDIYQDYYNTRTIFLFESANKEEDPMPESVDTKEKKLTTKARKSLPSGAFALIYKDKKTGKTVRRFPIHDAAHARNALARLSQAKGLTPAQKATVKRKAQAALRRFTKGKYKPPKEFTPEQWEVEMTKLLEGYDEKEGDDEKDQEPLEIEVGPENYEVLFSAIEDLEEDLDKANEEIEILQDKLDGKKETSDESEDKEESDDTDEEPKESEESKDTPEEEPKDDPKEEEDTPKEEDSETISKILEDHTAETKSLLEASEKERDRLQSEFREVVSKMVASLKISAKRPEARGKTYEEVLETLKSKDMSYLVGTLEDLKADLMEERIDPEEIDEIEDPTANKPEKDKSLAMSDKRALLEEATKIAEEDYEKFRSKLNR